MIELSSIDCIVTSSVCKGSEPDGPIIKVSPSAQSFKFSTCMIKSPFFAKFVSLV